MTSSRLAHCLTLIATALLSHTATATQPLEAFLRSAAERNPDLREAGALAWQREAEADVSLNKLLPALNARATYTRNEIEVAVTLPGRDREVPITPRDQRDAVLQLEVPIVDLYNYSRFRAAQAVAEAARWQFGGAGFDVGRAVARAYYQLLGAAALQSAAQQSLVAAQANRDNVLARQSVGAATALDVQRATASFARSEQDLADASLGVALAARALSTLSGLSPEPASGPPPEDDLHEEPAFAQWVELAQRNSPQLRAARSQVDAAQASVQAAERALLPTLSALGQERVSNATGFSGRASNYSVQLTLAWRLDYSVRSLVDTQEAGLVAAGARQERASQAVVDGIYEAYARVQAGMVKCRAARSQAEAAARAAELALERHELGVATQLDVTQAQRDAYLAAAARIQADVDLAYARVALRFAAASPEMAANQH